MLIPEYTANHQFFVQHLGSVPSLSAQQWALLFHGMVRVPLTLRYVDLSAYANAQVDCTMACNGSTARNVLLSHAQWRGVAMRDLLDGLDIDPSASHAQLYGLDGYTTFVSLADLRDSLLATHMNGEELPAEHGYPARLIIPGLAGYKMPKWLQRIKFTDQPQNGFWEERGWPADGGLRLMAYLLSPHHFQTVRGAVTLHGIAFAGKHEVARVEISVNGAAWMPVTLEAAQTGTWVRWQVEWIPNFPGDHSLRVRAVRADGLLQGGDCERDLASTTIRVTP